VASRKGRSTQKLAAIKPPIVSTESRIRVRSQDGGAEDLASAFIPAMRYRAHASPKMRSSGASGLNLHSAMARSIRSPTRRSSQAAAWRVPSK